MTAPRDDTDAMRAFYRGAEDDLYDDGDDEFSDCYEPCQECDGGGLNGDGSSCPFCHGTGLVAVGGIDI